jgi:hypothetical protein
MMLEQLIDSLADQRCDHIFLAAWQRLSYLPLLQGAYHKLTLVEGAGMCSGLRHLLPSIRIVNFPGIFQSMSKQDFSGDAVGSKACEGCHSCGNMAKTLRSTMITTGPSVVTNEETLQVNASRVQNLIIQGTKQMPDGTRKSSARSKNWRERRNPERVHTPATTQASLSNVAFSSPQVTINCVPLNQAGQRLDPYMHAPTPEESQTFDKKYSVCPTCRLYHLKGGCRQGNRCGFDHTAITVETRRVFRYKLTRQPCKFGSTCRSVDCLYSHTCVRNTCMQSDCPMKEFHGIDKAVASWVPGSADPRSR